MSQGTLVADITEVRVPDIGDFEDVPVIEVMVAPGDVVKQEDSLITLESDKASMDVPAPGPGTVKEVRVSVGDTVSEGALILLLENAAGTVADVADTPARTEPAPPSQPAASTGATAAAQVHVPDIGDFSDVPVIEVMVAVGDTLNVDDPIVTLESDKASMDVPTPFAGRVSALHVKVGDPVSEGSLLISMDVAEGTPEAPPEVTLSGDPELAVPVPQPLATASVAETPGTPGDTRPAATRPSPTAALAAEGKLSRDVRAHASPAIRHLARELGVDLSRVKGTGRKGRVIKDDLKRFVKQELTKPESASSGAGIPQMPAVDFSKFGPVETQALSRIKKLSGVNLHRAWLVVPHVTQHDEADITELEAFRKAQGEQAKQRGVRLTLLAFLMKACVAALKEFPSFNASLAPGGEQLILKRYFHIGIAVDTPEGLVVPVIRDVDTKTVYELAGELGAISAKARDGKLSMTDLQGGCFSISSLGGIGGTAFTPIVNAPEVAILGVSRSTIRPMYIDGEFKPRLMLPLSLSYDHRIIDGAAAARFTAYLAALLSDIRRMLL
jgi:pyruvate dehydrogenase E2 component (dihydrolipoamide acetyltransferase)